MRAIVKYDYQDRSVEIRDIGKPAIGPDQVLIKVAAVGVCGSDIHMWRNHQSWKIKIPVVLGHEFCGVVAEVGDDVKSFAVGERVAVETAAYVCGECIFCRTGNYNLCPERLGYGNLIDGSMTEYVVARPQILHRLPDSIPFEHAALIEPICVANRTILEVSNVKPGDIVVVQGAGAIGIFSMLMAKISGAGTIIVTGTDIDSKRLAIARELGAHYTVNIQQEDPVALIKTLGDGYGAHLVVDCTGVSAALKQSIELVRPLGQITKVGWGPQPMNFSLDPLVQKAARIQTSFSHTYATWERSITMLAAGLIPLDFMQGCVYEMESWETAFSEMESGNNIKSVIKMGA
jgi:alcohol dehydrogenase/L-iditol 2-dehydrogenase